MKNHGSGDITVLKFRKIDLAKNDFRWDYLASSPNRYFENGVRFGDRTYKHINGMAQNISQIINPNENIQIVDGKPLTKLNLREGLQYSVLNNDEMLELTKKILYLRAGNLSRPKSKLEEIAI